MPDPPQDEIDWLRQRIQRYRAIMTQIPDKRALQVLLSLIDEAEARIAEIEGRET